MKSGRLISFLGDSITTLEGYNPANSLVYYTKDFSSESGVLDITDTWWGKVLEHLESDLLVNDSYSGSTVTQANWAMAYPASISQLRLNNLSNHGMNPEIIIIFMGTNDFVNGVPIKSEDSNNLSYFYDAYRFMLEKLKSKYESSELWLMTLSTTKNPENPNFEFPKSFSGIDIEEYNNVIRELANTYECKLVDLYAQDMPYQAMDTFHPNNEGMNDIFEAFKKAIK